MLPDVVSLKFCADAYCELRLGSLCSGRKNARPQPIETATLWSPSDHMAERLLFQLAMVCRPRSTHSPSGPTSAVRPYASTSSPFARGFETTPASDVAALQGMV